MIELDTGSALLSALDSPEMLGEVLAATTFVLLGASSAMGPLPLLLALGAHVVAVVRQAAGWR